MRSIIWPMEMTTIKSLALLLLLAASWSLCLAKPYRRRTRNSGPGDVRFKIKGVDRGMLESKSYRTTQ